MLDYSFRKSFLLTTPPLKPDEQPIQQLLPPEIPLTSLVRTYSFSNIKNHDSMKEQTSELSLDMNKNMKVIDELQAKIEELNQKIIEEKKEKEKILADYYRLDEQYKTLIKTQKSFQKDENKKN